VIRHAQLYGYALTSLSAKGMATRAPIPPPPEQVDYGANVTVTYLLE
jgi:hypothetical protein